MIDRATGKLRTSEDRGRHGAGAAQRDNGIILFCIVLILVFSVAFTLQTRKRHTVQARAWALLEHVDGEGPPCPKEMSGSWSKPARAVVT